MKYKYVIFLIFSLFSCRNSLNELPKAVQGFPIDTTITVIADLPSAVDESSGIIKWDKVIWTHNDSKNEAALFEIYPTTGKLGRTIQIADLTNKDWEELAQDDRYIYIGDFGNNHGNRKDLRIFKILKQEVAQNNQVTKVDTIHFSYPDQTDFTGPTHGHNFDCEAMIAVGDSLYLFSKEFKDKQSQLYSLPKTAGTHIALLKDRFDVKGNITGADMNEEGVLAMSGYYFDNGSFLPFVWMFWDYPAQSFFKGKHQRVNFDFQSQIEGICHDKEGQFFISSESTLIRDGQLFRFDTNPWVR